MSMPRCVRICSETSLIHGLPCQHPPRKASTLADSSGALPPVTAAVRVHSTLCTLTSQKRQPQYSETRGVACQVLGTRTAYQPTNRPTP